mgnify:CR=1 FL=1
MMADVIKVALVLEFLYQLIKKLNLFEFKMNLVFGDF